MRQLARGTGLLAWLALAIACAPSALLRSGLDLPESGGAFQRPDHVLIISVAGMTAEAYLGSDDRSVLMSGVAALARAGLAADGIEPVAPASTYPAHGSLVTGRTPARHGVPADHRLGDRGVRSARYWHASHLVSPTLWQVASEAQIRVAALGWPSTLGAAIDQLLPDIRPTRRGETWPNVVMDGTTPQLLELIARHGGETPVAGVPGRVRDAMLAGIACDLLASSAPPGLLFVHFSQTAPALETRGPGSREVRVAFARVDDEIARLLKCLRGAGRLDATAVFVVGDHGYLPVHTDVRPNVALARAHLLEPAPGARVDVRRWDAIARSNGGSAFVYARDESAALRARSALASAAEESRAFRIVSAEEMLRLGADPEAWFGLAAEPGFVFDDAPRPQLLQPAVLRSAGGYLPDQPQMRAGFAAWGRGLRSGIRIPAMRQVDVAPTVAQLLGLRLDGADGRPLVGVLGGSSAERSRSSSPRPRKRAAR